MRPEDLCHTAKVFGAHSLPPLSIPFKKSHGGLGPQAPAGSRGGAPGLSFFTPPALPGTGIDEDEFGVFEGGDVDGVEVGEGGAVAGVDGLVVDGDFAGGG